MWEDCFQGAELQESLPDWFVKTRILSIIKTCLQNILIPAALPMLLAFCK